MSHKVAVTGATGWIGRYVIASLLAKGYEVHAAYRTAPLALGENWHQVDLLNADEAARFILNVKPDSLIHLAWDSIPPGCYRSLTNYEWTRCSMALIHQFVQSGGKRVVVAGTGAEYVWGEGVLSETQSPDSYAHAYAACKNSLRIWLESYARIAGFSSAWARLFHLYGPADPGKRLVASMITSLLNKEEAYCRQGSLYRDYLYIQDAADALVALFESRCEGTVNIASGQPVQLERMVIMIGSLIGSEANIRFGDERPEEPVVVRADIARLQNEVQWKPAISLSTGLKKTVKWYSDRA
ncbi:NAD-dependent epimerase/dehydratase family protein [Paenibacillus glycanilyticus]|uniref:NAD-dependent epimerase/dehydratase family protein n=1 Tax=Paenibacillus glycanilyticus TaxID=126569 RepID=UPI000FDBBD72|nr:NAD(P)-dependent oxidoreductase [Paenibacillus glycanilyticus]